VKIAIFDTNQGKFTQDMQDWWEYRGHETKREYSYNPDLVRWADIIWLDGCDNNFHTATTGMTGPDFQENWRFADLDMTNKRVVIRVIDIEAWYGHHLGGDWNHVNDVIFIADHIRALVEHDIDFAAHGVRVHTIPCGVDTVRFNFVDKPVGTKIAWVCEKWPTKGIDYALQIMAALPRDFELHTIGGWNDRYAWEKAYQEDFIQRNKINFYDYEFVPDQNDWLADKDFILSCSKKEAFGYNIAEGMSKGLIPIVHHFYGAENLWPKRFLWDRIDEAVSEINGLWPQKVRTEFRDYLTERRYTLNQMMETINATLTKI
jgi:glycosyltransferase involved in cell wall biosynthesis